MANENRPVPKPDVYVPTKPFWDGRAPESSCCNSVRTRNASSTIRVPSACIQAAAISNGAKCQARAGFTPARSCAFPAQDSQGRLPLSVATVDLEEGVRIIANILVSNSEVVTIGQRVVLAWDQIDGDTPYPAFRLA